MTKRGVIAGTLLKVIVWRCLSVSVTLATIYAITGSLKKSTTVTVVLHGLLVALHFLFEMAWRKFYERR